MTIFFIDLNNGLMVQWLRICFLNMEVRGEEVKGSNLHIYTLGS
jgi:hypothetical protein